MSTISSFRSIENKHDVCSGRDCMKKLSESFLREHAMKIISFLKKLKLLTKEQQKSYENTKICYTCQEKFENKYLKNKKYCKVRYHCHYTGEYKGAAHSIYNLKHSLTRIILKVFYGGSNYDYHFIITKLTREFKKQFTCLGKSTLKERFFNTYIILLL